VLLVASPAEDLEIRWVDALMLELEILEVAILFVNKNLVRSAQVVGECGQESRPRSRNHVLAVVVSAEDDDLPMQSYWPRVEINGNAVTSPVTSERDPQRVGVGFLDGIRWL